MRAIISTENQHAPMTFGVVGFRVDHGLGLWVVGLGVRALRLRVLGFRVWGSGFILKTWRKKLVVVVLPFPATVSLPQLLATLS